MLQKQNLDHFSSSFACRIHSFCWFWLTDLILSQYYTSNRYTQIKQVLSTYYNWGKANLCQCITWLPHVLHKRYLDHYSLSFPCRIHFSVCFGAQTRYCLEITPQRYLLIPRKYSTREIGGKVMAWRCILRSNGIKKRW